MRVILYSSGCCAHDTVTLKASGYYSVTQPSLYMALEDSEETTLHYSLQ